MIAKINPVSNKPSKETAFSSTIWADATNKYVKKITTLKDDVWRELMDEASGKPSHAVRSHQPYIA
jgi:hypothetical protein